MPALSFLYSDYKQLNNNQMNKYIYEQQKFIDRDSQGDKRTMIQGEEATKQVCISDNEFKGAGVWIDIDSLLVKTSFETLKIVPTETAFYCTICGDSQPCNYFATIYFPVCDQCKKDIKEYVLSVRKK